MIAANIFGYFLTITNLPQNTASYITSLEIDRIYIMMLILLLYVIIGMFMDGLSAVMLTVPIFCPIVTSLGYDLVWFGVVVVLVIVLGAISPPIGINLFVAAGIDKKIEMKNLMFDSIPYCFALFAVTILLSAYHSWRFGCPTCSMASDSLSLKIVSEFNRK